VFALIICGSQEISYVGFTFTEVRRLEPMMLWGENESPGTARGRGITMTSLNKMRGVCTGCGCLCDDIIIENKRR
jgi:hypothetical protein